MTDVKKLNLKIEESGLKKVFIASKMGLSKQGLYNKLSGKREFTNEETDLLSTLLNLSVEEIQQIFLPKTWLNNQR